MAKREVKKALKEWANKIGKKQAAARLINRNVGISTVEQLLRGTYKSMPGQMLTNIIEEEIAKDQPSSAATG